MVPPDPTQRPPRPTRGASTTAAAEGPATSEAHAHIERLEVLARLEVEAARDDEERLWARIDREVLSLVRRLLKSSSTPPADTPRKK